MKTIESREVWVSSKKTSLSLGPNEREVASTLATLNTRVKPKNKRKGKAPLYFKTMECTRIKQGRTQAPTKAPIKIEESPSKKEDVGPTERNIDEVTSPENISKIHIAYLRGPTTRSTSFKKPKTPTTLQQKGNGKLQEEQSTI